MIECQIIVGIFTCLGALAGAGLVLFLQRYFYNE